ncbi:FKBP-type peptidylprolyl isomerase [Algoriphagus lacus]|uniref:Peptidyl-prolyl cis-trans isomerase n=1 Tax=Algoriphagus lacus TaxID=2056311 RepID=A0A418PVS9_9BACT|nr:FKBP-type peptidyl-prolyl cis-trans isomerase [Algoriphagus lacus]RIW18156.1 FKBP-type peptidylprolyl isomerase [Algoriphagus lacus]
MIKRLIPVFFLGLLALLSCEPTNPFNTGPAYDVEGNLKIDSTKIVAYLDTAKIDSLYRIHDPSGVVVIVQEEGVGTRPTFNTVVYTDYTGSLMEDGSVFDTSIETVARENNIYVEGRKYNAFSFIIGSSGVIQGWDIAFRRLRPGSKAVLIIPSPYGYRNQSNSDRIPPNSVLIFDVDFLGID